MRIRTRYCIIVSICLLAALVLTFSVPMDTRAEGYWENGYFMDTTFQGQYTTENLDAIMAAYDLIDNHYWTTQLDVLQSYHGSTHPGWTSTSMKRGKNDYHAGWYGYQWEHKKTGGKLTAANHIWSYGECYGFCDFMGYLLSGVRDPQAGGWHEYTSIEAAGGLRVGDIVRVIQKKDNNKTDMHSAMVYSVYGDQVRFIQASGGKYNKLRLNTSFQGLDLNAYTASKFKNVSGLHIYEVGTQRLAGFRQ